MNGVNRWEAPKRNDEVTRSPDDTSKYLNMEGTLGTTIPPFVVRATAIASLGGILFGYDMGVVSGALPQLTEAFQLTQSQQETVVSVLYLGGGFGAAVGGTICDMIGRKRTILITDIWFVVGAAILFYARTVGQIIFGRIVVGVAVAVSGLADVAYLHEIAPVEWRGSIVSVNEACISLGFLLAYVAGYAIDQVNPENGWRTMFGLSGVVALIQWVGMLKMPESPVWLEDKGRCEESREALRVIHGGNPPLAGTEIPAPPVDSVSEVDIPTTPPVIERRTSSAEKLANSNERPLKRVSSRDPLMVSKRDEKPSFDLMSARVNAFLVSLSVSFQQLRQVLRRYRRQVWIALMLSVTQQFCGQTPVLNYAPLIFTSVGLTSSHSSLGSTLLIGVVKFIVTVVVIWKIEYLGRRFLLLTGMSIIALGLLFLTAAFSTGLEENNGEEEASSYGGAVYLALPGVLLVVLGYSASFGPLTWLLTSELFPTDIRGRALGTSTIVTYLCASFVTYTFLSSQSRLGPSVVFATYGAITAVGVAFAYLAIPDTGGKSVEEIEGELNTMWWWRSDMWGTGSVSPSFRKRPTTTAAVADVI